LIISESRNSEIVLGTDKNYCCFFALIILQLFLKAMHFMHSLHSSKESRIP
jgi:hypothetical protein